jgi:hypothetical protein
MGISFFNKIIYILIKLIDIKIIFNMWFGRGSELLVKNPRGSPTFSEV